MKIADYFQSAVKLIPSLVSWILSPMQAPWEQPEPENVGPTITASVPGVVLVYPCLRLAESKLLLKTASGDFLTLFFSLSPLLIALLVAAVGKRFTRIQILRTCGWLYRNLALNILLIVLWGMTLHERSQEALGSKPFANFYVATYFAAVVLLVLNNVSFLAAREKWTVMIVSSAVYLAFLSFVIFICPILVPDSDWGYWWNPAG